MPGGDRTGPAGYGPLTGRGLGYCAGYSVPGFMNRPAYGRGLAHRRGVLEDLDEVIKLFLMHLHLPMITHPMARV